MVMFSIIWAEDGVGMSPTYFGRSRVGCYG
jgi:hypothetical protein